MIWFFIFTGLLIIYTLLIWLTPKGSLFQELLYIPIYWLKTSRAKPKGLKAERISYGDHQMQYLLLFEPPDGTIPKDQVIVYYHGGGWRFGVPSMFKSNAWFFLRQGYTVVMPCYRRIPKYHSGHIWEDLVSAVSKILEIREKKGWQKKGLVFGGMSAGGNLVALITLDKRLQKKAGLSSELIHGLFLCGAPLDLSQMKQTILIRGYAGPPGTERFNQASPINHISGDEQFPIFCIHGESDGMVEFASATAFVTAFRQKSTADLSFHILSKGSHLDAGSWPFQELPAAQPLRKWLLEINSNVREDLQSEHK